MLDPGFHMAFIIIVLFARKFSPGWQQASLKRVTKKFSLANIVPPL
jgi:hypothetical protein